MRVALVAGIDPSSPRPSGIRSHVLGLATALARGGNHVFIVGTGSPPVALPNVRFLPATSRSSISSFGFLLSLFRRASTFPIAGAVLHAHRPDDLVPFLRRRDLAARLVTVHGLSEVGVRERHGPLIAQVYRRLEAAGVRGAHRIIVLDHHTRTEFESRYPQAATRVAQGSGGVDLEQFAPMPRGEARARLGLGDAPTVAFVGRLVAEKNLELLFQAMSSVGTAQLVIAGEGPLMPRLRALAHNRPEIRFLGTLPHDVVAVLLNAADVLALPSHREAMPAVSLEALACGTPVVATRVGGLTNVIRDDVNGFLAEPTPPSLASRISVALERSNGMRVACRESVSRFGWETVATTMLRIYTEAAS